jgi:hypothetical protein
VCVCESDKGEKEKKKKRERGRERNAKRLVSSENIYLVGIHVGQYTQFAKE